MCDVSYARRYCNWKALFNICWGKDENGSSSYFVFLNLSAWGLGFFDPLVKNDERSDGSSKRPLHILHQYTAARCNNCAGTNLPVHPATPVAATTPQISLYLFAIHFVINKSHNGPLKNKYRYIMPG